MQRRVMHRGRWWEHFLAIESRI